MSWKARVPVLAAALWWGSLTTLGFLVVPLLFKYLPSPAMAGQTAAQLFTAQTWLSLACGMLLMMASRSGDAPARMDWARGALIYVFAGMLLALLAEFAVAPRITARDNLALWHAVGTGVYALQWACSAIVLWKLAGLTFRSADPS